MKVLPNYGNVTKSRCLIHGMSRNVTKCNEMKMRDLWNATNYYFFFITQCTGCRCLIYEMLRNAEAETTASYESILASTFRNILLHSVY